MFDEVYYVVTFDVSTNACDKLPISLGSHCSRISLLACLFRWLYSIALPVSSFIIASAYPGGIVCSNINIVIATSKRFRRLFYSRVATW